MGREAVVHRGRFPFSASEDPSSQWLSRPFSLLLGEQPSGAPPRGQGPSSLVLYVPDVYQAPTMVQGSAGEWEEGTESAVTGSHPRQGEAGNPQETK